MPDIRVAFWNLENLFDHENAQRDADLKNRLRSELRGWTAAIRDRKISQQASVIGQMFNDLGPDLLGVCEIENERVLRFLAEEINVPGRDYRILPHDSPDARGIDVSFIFDANTLAASNPDHQVVVKRNATRDLFWATFTETRPGGASFHAIANHWPARSAGQYESEPFRMLTGETASFVLSEELDNAQPIILMGDFNDEPFNRSMQEYLQGTRDRRRVTAAQSVPRVWNLMWPLMSPSDPGTYRFESVWNMLDQFLVTKGMLRQTSRVKPKAGTTEIFRPPAIRGSGGRPRAYGRPSKNNLDQDGFSDHFPILVVLETD